MFGEQFYPTPESVIAKMAAPYKNLSEHQILDPSAGRGDILDYMKPGSNYRDRSLYAIEKDPDLREILNGKGFRVIGVDFLTWYSDLIITLILMNPPFKDGVKHVLKAWEILADDGYLCALVNAETLRNDYTGERQQLTRLIDEHGEEPEFLGDCFSNGVRRTDVEVMLIRLHKPKSNIHFEFGRGAKMDRDHELDDAEFNPNLPAHRDTLQSLVDQYQAARGTLIRKHELDKQYTWYLPPDWDGDKHKEVPRPKPKEINKRMAELKDTFWKYIFRRTELEKRLTSKYAKTFQTFVIQTARLAFDADNIREVLGMFYMNRAGIMEQCMWDTYEQVIRYADGNPGGPGGWKTNKFYKVTPKIIIPRGTSYEKKWNSWSTVYTDRDFYTDMDKVFAYLDGMDGIEEITTIYDAIYTKTRELSQMGYGGADDYKKTFVSTYWTLKIHKIGTMHMWTRRQDLLDAFNLQIATNHRWLGDGS